MTAARRWALVGIGVLLLVTTPFLVRALPAYDDGTSAVVLLQRIQGSRDVAVTGTSSPAGRSGCRPTTS